MVLVIFHKVKHATQILEKNTTIEMYVYQLYDVQKTSDKRLSFHLRAANMATIIEFTEVIIRG